jgi:hypothetical protein
VSALDARLLLFAQRVGNYLRDTVLPRCETWVKLAADTSTNTTVNGANTALTFTAVANKTYLGAVDRLLHGGGYDHRHRVATSYSVRYCIWASRSSSEYHADANRPRAGGGSGATPQTTSGVRAAANTAPIFAEWIIEIGATGGDGDVADQI